MNTLIEFLNHWGDRCAGFALPMLVQSSLLIGGLLLLDFALGRHVRPAVRYALWLLVFVKLVLPPSLALPTSLGYWLAPTRSVTLPPPKPTTVIVHYSDVPRSRPPAVKLTPPAPALKRNAVLMLAWLGGVLGLLGVLLLRSKRVKRKVAVATEAPEELTTLLDECRRQLGLRKRVRLKIADRSMSPAVCGLWRPVVLLPQPLATGLSPLQLRAVLLHELAHLQHGDLWANYAQTFLQIFYWWQPLLWLANARIRRVREQAVDERVMVAMGQDTDTYPGTLLEVAKLCFTRPLLSLGLVGIIESKSALKQRIQRLVHGAVPKSAKLGRTGAVTTLLVAACLLPMARGERRSGSGAAEHSSIASGKPVLVTLEVRFVALPETELVKLTLGQPTLTFPNGHRAWVMTAERLRALIHRLEQRTGMDILTAPRVTTVDGRQAQIKPVGVVRLQAKEVEVGPTCDLTPHVRGKQIDLEVAARITEAVKVDSGARETSVNAIGFINRELGSGRVAMEDGGGVLLNNPAAKDTEGNQYLVMVSGLLSKQAVELDRAPMLTVTVAAEEPHLYLGSRAVTLDELKEALAKAVAEAPQTMLAIRADEKAPFDQIVKVMDAANAANIRVVASVRRAEEVPSRTREARDELDKAPRLTVTVAAEEPHLYLDSRAVTLDELKEALAKAVAEAPQTTLAIRADTEAPFDQIAKVMHAANAANIKAVYGYEGRRAEEVPAQSPEARDARILEARMIQDARVLIEMGKLHEAETNLERVIKLDPSNKIAFYYMNIIQERQALEAARKSMSVSKQEAVEVAEAQHKLELRDAELRDTEQSYERAVTPSWIVQVLGKEPFLRLNSRPVRSEELAQAIATEPPMSPDGFLLIRKETGASAAALWKLYQIVQVATNIQRISIVTRDGSGGFGGFGTGTGKASDLDDRSTGSSVASQAPPDARAPLFTRIFKVDPNTFNQGLETFRRKYPTLKPHFSETGASESASEKVRRFCEACGAKPEALFYNDRTGVLMALATAADLQVLETALEVLNVPSPQIMIEARFVWASAAAVSRLDLGVPIAKDEKGATTWLLTEPKARALLKTIEQAGEFDVVPAPKVTTLSERQAQIQVVEPLPTSGDTPLPGMPTLDVVPEVAEDGYTVQMRLIPSVVEFAGYDDPGKFIPQAPSVATNTPGIPWTAQLALPHLWSHSFVTNNVNVWDGQTVVLGGLPAENVLQKIKEMVPVLGDLPTVGKLFRSEASAGQKKSLLIFVTPTIVDPAGNAVHTRANLPYDPNIAAPQPETK